MAEIKPIRFTSKDTLDQAADISDQGVCLAVQFAPLAKTILSQKSAATVIESVHIISGFLEAAASLDDTYGQDAELPVEGAANAADEACRAMADLQNQLHQLDLTAHNEAPQSTVIALDAIVIGIGLWCMRHQLVIVAPEPIINALARRANEAASKQETAATFALMQGFVALLRPMFQADLERSNPDRPWRVLNVNFAITAIRTGDETMMRYAFDNLNETLPDERSGFYAEAHTLASLPGFPDGVRNLIEQEHRRFSPIH